MCKGVPRRPKVSSSQRFGALQRFYITAAVFTAVSLVTPYNEQIFAASPDAAEGPEKTVPQGKDPPGNDNEDHSNPTTEHKGVIKPPQTGDEGIYTQAPNPNAGTEEEVIPPPVRPKPASERRASLNEITTYPAAPRCSRR
jgi:hypothetical protein